MPEATSTGAGAGTGTPTARRRPFDPRLLRHARATWPFLLGTVALGALQALVVVAQAVLLARVLSEVFLGGLGVGDLRAELVALAVVVAARGLLVWGQDAASAAAAAAVRAQLRTALLRRVVGLGPAWLSGQRSGELAQVAGRGVDALDGYFARYLPQLVLSVLVPGAVLLAMGWADLLSAVIVLLTLPLVPFFLALVGLTTQVAQRRQWRALERLGAHFLDVVDGLPTLRAFGRGRAQADRIAAVTDDYRQRTMTVLRVSFLSAFVLELAATLSVALVAVSVGLRLAAGDVTLTTALVVLLLAPEAYLPLRQVGAAYHAAAEGVAASAHALDVLDLPVPARGTGPLDVPRGSAALAVEGVSVAFEGRGTVLPPTSLTVSPGEVVALTGPSGCGKTSLLHAVLGLVPAASGTVRLGATDLAAVDPARWHARVAWAPQRPGLVAGTLADNVRLGLADAGDDAVRLALRLAAAEDLDPDRALAEDGVGVSGGQRQRIGLARAFCRVVAGGADVLLLDEPTSQLDAATEARVVASLRALAAGRCVLVVVHREAVAAAADRVVDLGRTPVAAVTA
ncbi:thiol reductant ABC exporter subunit CydD [Aquipuribacter sp. SD81]|uniref:thiol reductant ABC exporter subunit CydD n=1 Tax=Aquipuribacter sp. SD81 TaxID=3127703 RepID=UPI0030170680